jgi:hypothetical protein
MRIISRLLLAVAIAGCATPTATFAPPAPGTAYRGEVWNYDRQASTVTLRQGANIVRVKVTPEQIDRLELHQIATVYGEPAPPADIERVVLPPGTLVPRGAPGQTDVTGTVTALDPAGIAAVDSPRGPLKVWTALQPVTPLKAGDEVRVRIRVQPLAVAPAGTTRGAEPSLSVMAEPGEYAVLTGRIIGVDPSGRLTVESLRGPVTVLVTDPAQHRAGDWVEVRTSLHPATPR